MINKDSIKGFVSGALVMAALSTTVFAAPLEKNIAAVYDNIKVYVDGILIQPKDAAGNAVEPFMSDGTTYLPVRAIGEALGKNVGWDENSKSVYIGEMPQEEEVPEQDIEEITVNDAKEFIQSIGSNRKIILKQNVYNLSEVSNQDIKNNNITWEKVVDGVALKITGVSNMTIQGDGDKAVDIVAEPRYGEIFRFSNCRNISLDNIKAGHTIIPDKYECNAGVLLIEDSKNISISGSTLYGCGSIGLTTRNVIGLSFSNSIIEDCNLRVMDLWRSKNFSFDNSIFRNCKYQDMFTFYSSQNIIFNNCEIKDNVVTEQWKGFINSEDSTVIKFLNSKFINNKADNLNNPDAAIDFTGTTFEGNSFDINK